MSKLEQLRADLDEQIKHFQKESDKHKHLHRKLRHTVFGLTGLSTLLASIALVFPAQQQWVNLIVVLTTATIGITSSIEGLRKPAELWILERNIFHALNDLSRELEFQLSDQGTTTDLDSYFNRMQSILNESVQKWSGTVTPNKN